MKGTNFIIFFSVFLLLYGLVNFYIYLRGSQALPKNAMLHRAYTVFFLAVSLSYVFGRVLEKFYLGALSKTTIWAGSFWLACMLYLFLALLAVDLFRLLGYLIPYLPSRESAAYVRLKTLTGAGVLAAVVILVGAGYVNAARPRVSHLRVDVSKRVPGLSTLNIVLVTDIHMGTVIRNSRLDNLVRMVNALGPDVILLAGDIVDEDLAPVIAQNSGAILCRFRSRYGVYAVTGNHEYIGGVEPAVAYLTRHGIRFLRDEHLLVDGKFYLVGREDRQSRLFLDRERKPLEEILGGVDKTRPVILLDHQPVRLNDAAVNGVDLQLSGHTHQGQLWPVSLLVSKIYRISHGYGRILDTHFYVSSGFGTWGPPVRVGNRPEIVQIQVHFKQGEM